VTAQLDGFDSETRSFTFDQQPQHVDFAMRVGTVGESITVDAQTPAGARPKVSEARRPVVPSQNVVNLQRRAAGVLPVRVDVPRAGTSHQFVKPLVVDQETVVNLRYKRR
jgi:hypothetical protein